MLSRCIVRCARTSVCVGRPAYTDAEISAALGSTVQHTKAFPPSPAARAWAGLNTVSRTQFQAFLSTLPRVSLLSLREEMAAAEPFKPAANTTVLEDWSKRTFPDILSLARHYESVFAPAHKLTMRINELTLESYGLKDMLKLKKASADQLAKAAKRLEALTADLEKTRRARDKYVATSFDTEIYNCLINIMRLCGETDEHAYNYSIRLLDDMTVLGVKFDAATQLLLKNITFGDEPGDDSDMLFAFVEFPEMGDVSLSKAGVDTVVDNIIPKIGKRHNITLTDGLFLKDKGTHPNLPRATDDDSS